MRETGPVEQSVMATAGRIAVAGRLIVVGACTALLPVQAPLAVAVGAVAGIALWQVIGWVGAGSGADHPRRTVAAGIADVAVLAGACLLLPRLHPPHGPLDLDDWARQVTSICVVTWQWRARAVPGLLATLTTAGAVAVGGTLASDGSWTLGSAHALWLLQQGLVSRALVVLVARGARHVDALTGALATTDRDARLAAARRADVEEHLTTLHDTVAATLTTAAAHGVGGEQLAVRARADLSGLTDVLPSDGSPAPGGPATRARPDLLSAPAAAGSPECPQVTVVVPGGRAGRDALDRELAALPLDAVRALAAARDEALRNVARHAGTDQARVELRPVPTGGVELTVVDDGRGFRSDVLPGPGLGLLLSIQARTRSAGGDSQVLSAPGHGTRVELRWPSAPSAPSASSASSAEATPGAAGTGR